MAAAPRWPFCLGAMPKVRQLDAQSTMESVVEGRGALLWWKAKCSIEEKRGAPGEGGGGPGGVTAGGEADQECFED